MERHHFPTHCVAGICDLVASGDVQQEEKIKTAGRMPAILKYNFLYDYSSTGGWSRNSYGTPPFLTRLAAGIFDLVALKMPAKAGTPNALSL